MILTQKKALKNAELIPNYSGWKKKKKMLANRYFIFFTHKDMYTLVLDVHMTCWTEWEKVKVLAFRQTDSACVIYRDDLFGEKMNMKNL